MALPLTTVTVPGAQNIPLHSAGKGSPFFRGQSDGKESTFLKVGRYIVLAAGKFFPAAASPLTVTSLQKALNSGGALETLLSGKSTGDNLVEGIQEVTQSFQHPASTTTQIAGKILTQSAYAFEKVDGVLWAIDNFGLTENLATNTMHGAGFAASLGIALKNYLEVVESTKEIDDSIEKQSLVQIKKAKFALAASAAVVGFFTLLSKATYLAILWVALALGSTVLSLIDHFYEKSIKGESAETIYNQQYITPPTFQTI